MKLTQAWRLWAKALGEKAHENNKQADIIAYIRTAIFLLNAITCILIATNILIGWL
jgi:hypothetical protein